MPSLTIPGPGASLRQRPGERAAQHGRPAAGEARQILQDGVGEAAAPAGPEESLDDAMQAIYGPIGGHDFPLVREPGSRPPPDFSGPEWDLPPDAT
jgi:plasmid stability protein